MKPAVAAALCLLCLSCAALPLESVKRNVPADFLGVAHAGYSRSDAEYALLRTLGARFSRIDFSWDRIEPEKGLFDFSFFDGVLDKAAENGVGILAILDYDVPWIHPDGKKRGYVPPGRMADWLEYVRRVTERYRGRIFAYEVWNEPNWAFWTGSAEEFADLTRESVAVIRRADPGVKVVVGGFYGGPLGFAGTMLRRGALEQADAVSYHPYARNAPSVAETGVRFMRGLRDLGWEGDFWVTEVGYATRGIYPNSIPDSEAPSALVKTVVLLTATGVGRIVWYALTDKYMETEEPRGENLLSVAEGYFGLAYPDYSPKRTAYAYAAVARVILGSVFDPSLVTVEPGAEAVRIFPFLRMDGSLGLVLWADRRILVGFSRPVRGQSLSIMGPGGERFERTTCALSPEPEVLIVDGLESGAGRPFFSIRAVPALR